MSTNSIGAASAADALSTVPAQDAAAIHCARVESAARMVRIAIGLFAGQADPPACDLEGVGECARVAAERLTEALDGCSDDVGEERALWLYDALDGLTVVRALIQAGIEPRHRLTISPIMGTLQLVLERLEGAPEVKTADPGSEGVLQ
jgi:hypothetical protein